MSERIQKALAQAGHGSRRQVEAWVQEGRITVNGKVVTPGAHITEDDKVLLDGKQLRLKFKHELPLKVILYHKPEGEICTRNDPERRATIYDNLPKLRGGRWVAVGRLDINTSGMLLLTTSGELANKLMHPSSGMEREYAVRVLGEVDRVMIKQLREGVELDDGMASFDSIRDAGGQGANHWYHIIIKEGRKREVRRLWESQGVTVSRLIRVRFGDIILPRGLSAGKFVDLDMASLNKLLRTVDMPAIEKKQGRSDARTKTVPRVKPDERPKSKKRASPKKGYAPVARRKKPTKKK
ncbi:MAG: pseudouridine synthase [Gammaproteobacteria bacterium]|nr:pseudouridine synthase [Gammaproteobacteria bacterium]